MTLDLALGHALEPLVLAALPLREHDVEPRADVGLRLLERLGDGRLARPQPLGDLLDRATALDRLRLQLVERLGHRLSGCPLELLAEPEDGAPLLVRRRAELRRLGLEAGRHLGERLLVALLERRELRLDVSLSALEVLGEGAQPLLQSPLRARELLDEGVARPSLALRVLGPALLGEPALLRGELGDGVRPLARQDASDLLRVGRRLGLDRFADRPSGVGDEPSVAAASVRARRSASQRTAATATAPTSAATRIQTATRAG